MDDKTLLERAARAEPLVYRIRSASQVKEMDDEELATMEGLHGAEIASLIGSMELHGDNSNWMRRARQALRVLRLHLDWIRMERGRRQRQEKRERVGAEVVAIARAKVEVQQEMTNRKREVETARMARIQAANDETARQVSVFKVLVRERLGEDEYRALWAEARRRMGDAPGATLFEKKEG